MKSSAVGLTLLLVMTFGVMAQGPYQLAVPGYRYEFPRDYFNHPAFQTEWWYYTGNLTGRDGHRFGFELTFFRQAVNRDSAKPDTWDLRDLYLAHLALSDLDGKHFYHTERTNRAGLGIAGVDEKQRRIWNGNWNVTWHGDDQSLQGIDERFAFILKLHPEKPPVIQGENGVSQKSAGAGHASHYISLTRLKTEGSVQRNGKSYEVAGVSWMDHEFFTHQLDKDEVGWDWFSVQLNDNTELMFYRMRRKDGSIDPYSSGTYVDANGRATHLRLEELSLTPVGETWRSPATAALYPVHWRIAVPKLALELELTTPLETQELAGESAVIPSYWEGAVRLNGTRGKTGVSGVGYLEMTGYDRAVELH